MTHHLNFDHLYP